jgi:dipeptidyl aminopeptidase/acylaminoacyl peptidase
MRRISLLISFITIIATNSTMAQLSVYGIFEGQSDIGDVKIDGSVAYDKDTDEYLVGGSGENIWFNSDEFHYLWRIMEGDFILYAKMKFIGDNPEPHRKGGWMIRQGLDPNAPHISVTVHGDGLAALQYREKINGEMSEIRASVEGPNIIQLERKGDTFTMKVAKDGEVLEKVGEFSMDMSGSVYAGLFVCSHNEYNFQQIIFNNVRISVPAEAGKENSREGVSSRLEILNLESLNRRRIYAKDDLFEAPNWSFTEPELIFNGGGKLYKIPVSGGEPAMIETGELGNLNNDHGISPDGKWIAASNGDQGTGSRVYVIPYEGGKPKLVTEQGPSYWHGWSADSKKLAFVGGREISEHYDIYEIKRNGGKETRLTSSNCLDDGPDYSLDGKYIYFNSCQSGTMQIWRMKTDGTEQEQLTSDDYQNWFPHPSPDGKWIAFISYVDPVDPGDHPPNKNVMLRLMPADGGDIKAIAHLYGGQGTINVPSWSPDSKEIAFVSYTY